MVILSLPHHCILDVLVYESLLQKEPHPNLVERTTQHSEILDSGLGDNWVGCCIGSLGKEVNVFLCIGRVCTNV